MASMQAAQQQQQQLGPMQAGGNSTSSVPPQNQWTKEYLQGIFTVCPSFYTSIFHSRLTPQPAICNGQAIWCA